MSGLLSGVHLSVDGSPIQAWAWHKSYRAKVGHDDDNVRRDPEDHSCSNDTHESKTESDARFFRKGNTASGLRLMGHDLSDTRHGLRMLGFGPRRI